MKFAKLVLDSNKGMENIGDWVQVFAIENLYTYMNVNLEEVSSIKISELNSYDGEKVILPINYPFLGYYNLSSQIIPVYLGISLINRKAIDGLKMMEYQPIGCRDYHTLQEMKKAGLEAYYGGCLTITLPKRGRKPINPKVFIGDVSEKIYDVIPDDIKKNAEIVKHVYFDNESLDGESRARKIYKKYEEEAGLVITSKIHCAQPCLAMGIPVIFICETISFRYDVIRNYIPVYTLENIDEVNWNPEPVELEYHKKCMLENAAERVWGTYNKVKTRCEINDFFMQGEALNYKVDSVWAFQEYIKERWDVSDDFSYAIWGVSQIAESIYEWVKENYPKARCVKVFDRAVRREFHGVMPEVSEGLKECAVPVFVTGVSVNAVAKQVFDEYGIKKYVICFNGLYIVDGETRTY